MQTLKRRTLSMVLSFVLMMLLALVYATSAFADGGGSLSPTINGGSLAVANNGSASITSTTSLDGTDKSLTIAVPLTVTDPTGTGSGWHLSVYATQFATAANANPFRTIPSASATFTNVTSVACGTNSTCSLPTNSKSTGMTVPEETATSDGTTITYGSATPLSFYNAAANTGMGVINMQANFAVNLPASTTYAGAYSSTMTITVASAP